MVLDGTYRFDVRMDGVNHPVYTGSAYTAYPISLSTGYIDGDTFVIHSRYLQTAFRGIMWLKKTPTGLSIKIRKDKLHQNSMYFYMEAEAEKIL